MRVIAGEYRRRTLVAPRGIKTRPTTDRLRETLFNVLAPRLAEASFLDLYAGSGANGIEALSRGAARVVFVEQAAPALAAIRENLAALKVPPGLCSVEARAAAAWLRTASTKDSQPFDIVFLDPPYDHAEEYATALGLLGGTARSLLAPGAVVVAEHRRTRRGVMEALAEEYGVLTRTRLLEQGDGALSFYELSGTEVLASTREPSRNESVNNSSRSVARCHPMPCR